MISDNMSTGKATAVVGLGLSAMLVSQAQSWYPQWREAGLSGAPAWAEACIIAGLCFPLVARLYRLLFCPLELLRSPDDVGYIVEDGRTKAQAANEVRRRRKAGELPPIYPNGWYRVLDSHQLGRGEVKSVSLLGILHMLSVLLRQLCACSGEITTLLTFSFTSYCTRSMRKGRSACLM